MTDKQKVLQEIIEIEKDRLHEQIRQEGEITAKEFSEQIEVSVDYARKILERYCSEGRMRRIKVTSNHGTIVLYSVI